MNRNGMKWNREETILAFDLYCRIPRSKISQKHPEIIDLAELLGRTAGSVALKMFNLGHYDPELQKKNLQSMSHGSKLDGEIFNEFSKDWEALSYYAQIIKAQMRHVDLKSVIDISDLEEIPPGEYREVLMKQRVGQYFFRLSVLSAYENRCCITGLAKPDLLIASHIKPWKDSDAKTERTNPSNGLCLNSLHDVAFDRGLITLDNKYRVIISPQLKNIEMDSDTHNWFMSYDHKQIILPEKFLPGKDFIEYHNDIVYQR